MLGRPQLLVALAAVSAACAAAAGCARAPASPLEPVAPLVLYPTPRWLDDAPSGLRARSLSLAFDSALPPDLSPAARAAWDAGGVDRFVVRSRQEGGNAVVHLYGESDPALGYARAVAAALVDRGGYLHLATVVDGAAFELRGFVEGHYGAPLQRWQRRCVLDLMVPLRGNLYLYGPKGDPFSHERWADPYPPADAAALVDAVAVARARGLDFAWAVSPGLEQGYPAPGRSISYASDADFVRLAAKIDAMRALGVTRFALFLDDIERALVYDADRAAFATPAAAHVALANRLDAYVTAAGAPHLLFVGPYYMSALDGWQAWAAEVGATLRPGIDVMWTGNAVAPPTLSADDLREPDARLGRSVVIWSNEPRDPVALTGFSPVLPTAARGLLANTILMQEGYGYSFADLLQVAGTVGDYTWNPAAYDPDRSLAAWGDLLTRANPCGDASIIR